jgi:hypothetical protein
MDLSLYRSDNEWLTLWIPQLKRGKLECRFVITNLASHQHLRLIASGDQRTSYAHLWPKLITSTEARHFISILAYHDSLALEAASTHD